MHGSTNQNKELQKQHHLLRISYTTQKYKVIYPIDIFIALYLYIIANFDIRCVTKGMTDESTRLNSMTQRTSKLVGRSSNSWHHWCEVGWRLHKQLKTCKSLTKQINQSTAQADNGLQIQPRVQMQISGVGYLAASVLVEKGMAFLSAMQVALTKQKLLLG